MAAPPPAPTSAPWVRREYTEFDELEPSLVLLAVECKVQVEETTINSVNGTPQTALLIERGEDYFAGFYSGAMPGVESGALFRVRGVFVGTAYGPLLWISEWQIIFQWHPIADKAGSSVKAIPG